MSPTMHKACSLLFDSLVLKNKISARTTQNYTLSSFMN